LGENTMSTSEVEQYIPLLISRLQQIEVAKVILFGSYAYGTPTEASDIDLMVVLNSDHYPGSYKEKSELYLKVSRVIRDIRQQIPIDLIVHTNSMHEKFIELDSMFSKEVLQKGKVLYEANNPGMVR